MKIISFFFCFSLRWSTGGMNLTGENGSTRRKTCPRATLSTTNPTWTNPGSNPGFRGDRPATNRLSHGTALSAFYGTRKFITAFVRPYHLGLILSQTNPLLAPILFKIHLIVSSHLRLGLQSGIFLSCLPTKTLYAPLPSPHTCYMPHPPHSYLFYHPNNILWVKIMKIPSVLSPQFPYCLIHFRLWDWGVLQRRGNADFKFLSDTGFICDKACATAAVLKKNM
jgi:hypothetical protein